MLCLEVQCARMLILFFPDGWDRILDQLKSIQTSGGIRLKEHTYIPVLTMVLCDNKEAHTLASVKSGKTHRPCRLCTIERHDMSAFTANNPLRSGTQVSQAMRNGKTEWLESQSVHSDVPVRVKAMIIWKLCLCWRTDSLLHRTHSRNTATANQTQQT